MDQHVPAKKIIERWGIQPFQLLGFIRDGLPAYENGRRIYDTKTLKLKPRYTPAEIERFAKNMFESGMSPQKLFFAPPMINHQSEGEIPFAQAWIGKRPESRTGEITDDNMFNIGPQYSLAYFLMDALSDDAIQLRASEIHKQQKLEIPRDVLHMDLALSLDSEVAQTVLTRVLNFSFLEADTIKFGKKHNLGSSNTGAGIPRGVGTHSGNEAPLVGWKSISEKLGLSQSSAQHSRKEMASQNVVFYPKTGQKGRAHPHAYPADLEWFAHNRAKK